MYRNYLFQGQQHSQICFGIDFLPFRNKFNQNFGQIFICSREQSTKSFNNQNPKLRSSLFRMNAIQKFIS